MSKWFYPKGELASGAWEVQVNDTTPGWKYTGLKVGDLAKQTSFEIPSDKWERAILPLEGESITCLLYTSDAADE